MEPLFTTTTLEKFSKKPEANKFQFEYQELCSELEPLYGKVIWSLPYKSFATEFKIRQAHEIAKSKGIVKYGYLIGILKRLP